jgi:hypothetical protein
LIKGRGIVVYPDDAIRLAVSRAVAVENPRGWRIAKEKASHKIDVVVALAMAALAAVEQGQRAGLVLGLDPIALAPRTYLGDIGADLTNPTLSPGGLTAAEIVAAGPSVNPSTVSPWEQINRETGMGGVISLAHLGLP